MYDPIPLAEATDGGHEGRMKYGEQTPSPVPGEEKERGGREKWISLSR